MSRHIYKPMLAKALENAFTDKEWLFEIKWDGFRAISYVETPFSIKSRNGKELRQMFPELHELTKLANNIVVDGEIVIMHEGNMDFQALLERRKAVSQGEIQLHSTYFPAVYLVFDILEKDNNSLINLPLIERKKILHESLKEGHNTFLCDFIEEKGETYFQSVLKKGLEGVVAKKKCGLYEEGLRSGSWLKIKKLKTCECVIFGYTKGLQSRENTFGALVLGLYDENKNPVYVGRVGTGFDAETLKILSNKFEKIKTVYIPFQVEKGVVVTWLQPRMVCEIEYQTITSNMHLRMARFKSIREDKLASECTLSQIMELKEMNKTNSQNKVDFSSSSDKLSEYALKRSFEETPEPKGGQEQPEKSVFVIHEHNARRLHYDLRLENGGVLKSWAVPKGMPEPGERRLAVETEDHPYEYANFEGVIPQGQYGAGTVRIWDKGHYKLKVWETDKIEFALEGQHVKGRYVLIRLKKNEEKKNWLLLKAKEHG